MELSGLQIFKYLPCAKKLPEANCKKCGFPTCMAFSLKTAKKQTDISNCPYAPDELKEMLNQALKVQQNEICFGINNELKTGGETVMFRHDKTFVNKTVIAVTLESNDPQFDKKLARIKNYKVERLNETYKIDVINLIDTGRFSEAADKIIDTGISLIINTCDTEEIERLKAYNPIINFADNNDSSAITAIESKDLNTLAQKSINLQNQGFNKLVLYPDISDSTLQKAIEDLTYIRRLSILERNEAFVFPVMTRIKEKDIYKVCAIASALICRYTNILILDVFNEALLTTLFTLRQNLYTDPQKPLQVESKVYEVNEPDENSVVMMTTNFALTYFAVLGEIESSPFSTYLVITPSDGMSVLTAWSAEKFTPEIAAKIIKESEVLQKVKNKKIIIPGLLAHMREELEEAIDGWEIVVGPKEAYHLQDFVKKNITAQTKK